MTEQMLWEAIVVPVGYRLGMLVPNGISVMNISWNLPNGSINCRCVDLMALTASMNSSASASAKFVNENTKRPYGNEIESVITLEALETLN